jgi:hypothetical protein
LICLEQPLSHNVIDCPLDRLYRLTGCGVEQQSLDMLKHFLSAGVASLALVLSAAPSPASNSTQGIIIESPIAGVAVVTVSTSEVNDDQLVEPAPAVVVTNNIIVVVASPNRRLEQLRRAFGHRYLGFIKVYSGPRYPF